TIAALVVALIVGAHRRSSAPTWALVIASDLAPLPISAPCAHVGARRRRSSSALISAHVGACNRVRPRAAANLRTLRPRGRSSSALTSALIVGAHLRPRGRSQSRPTSRRCQSPHPAPTWALVVGARRRRSSAPTWALVIASDLAPLPISAPCAHVGARRRRS